MTVTLKDIAKMAGVSTATVSRVINNKDAGNMRPETRERILSIIKETMYSPNPLASGLRHGHSKVIGMVMPSNINPYYSRLGNLMENEAFKNGYLLLLCNSHYNVERERTYLNLLKLQRVTGVILCCGPELTKKDIDMVGLEKNRLILVDDYIEGYDGPSVIVNDFEGGKKGAGYLFGLGHSNILIITGPEDLDSSRRFKGVLSAYQEWDVPFNSKLVCKGDYSIDSAKKAVSEAIGRNLEFTAVFAFNDMMAIGAIATLRHYGLNVPGDISVIGYDDIPLAELYAPEITTIAASSDEMVQHAFSMIMANEDENEEIESDNIVIDPQLIIRKSCRHISK